MMQLTEQQRAELERRGWRVKWRTGSFETWEHPAYSVGVHVWVNGEIGAMGNIGEVLEFAAAVGYAPPGHRLVQEEVAQKVLPFVQALAEQRLIVAEGLLGVEERAEAFEEHRALMALASALQGKEMETRD